MLVEETALKVCKQQKWRESTRKSCLPSLKRGNAGGGGQCCVLAWFYLKLWCQVRMGLFALLNLASVASPLLAHCTEHRIFLYIFDWVRLTESDWLNKFEETSNINECDLLADFFKNQ